MRQFERAVVIFFIQIGRTIRTDTPCRFNLFVNFCLQPFWAQCEKNGNSSGQWQKYRPFVFILIKRKLHAGSSPSRADQGLTFPSMCMRRTKRHDNTDWMEFGCFYLGLDKLKSHSTVYHNVWIRPHPPCSTSLCLTVGTIRFPTNFFPSVPSSSFQINFWWF